MLLGVTWNPATPLPPAGLMVRAPAWQWSPTAWRAAKAAGYQRCLVIDRESCTTWGWAHHAYQGSCNLLAAKYPDPEWVEAANEPDGTGDSSSAMDKADFWQLIRAARTAWPHTKLISGGLVAIDFSYFAGVQMMGANYAGAHFYAQTGDTLPAIIAACRQATTLPIACTEFGGQLSLWPSEHDRAVWYSGMIVAGWEQGLTMMLAYRYDENGQGFGIQGTESEAAVVDAVPNVAGPPPASNPVVWIGSPNFY